MIVSGVEQAYFSHLGEWRGFRVLYRMFSAVWDIGFVIGVGKNLRVMNMEDVCYVGQILEDSYYQK